MITDTITIHAVSPKVEYHISINSKVTLITGHSGEGKTLFYNAINAADRSAFKVSVDLNGVTSSEYTVQAVPAGESTFLKGIKSSDEKNILIFDDTDYVLSNEFAKFFKEDTKNLFIIINRFNNSGKGLSSFEQVPVSVYTLVSENNGKVHKIKPYSTFQQ